MPPLKHKLHSVLKKTEKYAKTDMIYLASGGFWSGVGVVFSGLLALATSVAFANLLPKETYGTYQYIISMIALVSLLGLPGMKSAISYASARDKDASFLEALRTKMRWNYLSAFAAFSIALYYFYQANYQLSSAFTIVACFLPFWEIYGNYVPYLQGKKKFKSMTIYEIATQAFNAVAVIVVIFLSDSLLALLTTFLASWTIGRFFFFKLSLKKYPPNNERDPATIPYGKHLSVMSVLGAIASNVDKLLIWQFLGPVEVAVYTFALAIPNRVVSSFASINRLYFPKAVHRTLHEVRYTLIYRIFILFLVTASCAGLYVFIAPYFFALFFPQYMEAVPYTQILGILIALQPFSLLATSLSAHARKKELYAINIIIPVSQIILLSILVPALKITGAIVALSVAQILESILLVILFLWAAHHTERSSSVALHMQKQPATR